MLLFFTNFYKFIMLIQEQQQVKEKHFDIVYNARSSRASRSRKSSMHNLQKFQKERPLTKTKKLRKMTLNPQSFRYQQIKQNEEMHNQHRGPRSQRGEKDQQMNAQDIFQLGVLIKNPSKKEQQLQNGIFVGIGNQRELDSDFDLRGKFTQNGEVNLLMHF